MELHRFSDVDGVLTPDACVGTGPDRAWGLGAGDGSTHFSIEIELVEGSFAGFGVGILSADVSLQQVAASNNSSAFRVMIEKQELIVDTEVSKLGQALDDPPRLLRLECVVGPHPGLFYSVNRQSLVELTHRFGKPIAPGAYNPCFSASASTFSFRCRVVHSARTSSRRASDFVARTGRALWDERLYTDVLVRTKDDQRIPCHRAHLAGGSPVFAAQLARWADDGKPEIDATGNHAEVEAMLEYFYTGELREGVSAPALLAVAHCYQNNDFISAVIERLFSDLSPQTVVAAVRALAPLRDEDEHLRLAWRELCARVVDSRAEMVEVLMLGMA